MPVTVIYRLWYRFHGGDCRWTKWQLGALSESEATLRCWSLNFADSFPAWHFEWVIEPEGESPECAGGIPAGWKPPGQHGDGWWEALPREPRSR